MDGAAVSGVTQSWTRLKRLSSSREAWRAATHGVAKSRTRLSDWTELNWTESTCNLVGGLRVPQKSPPWRFGPGPCRGFLRVLYDSMDMSLSELRQLVMDGEPWRADSWGRKELDTTEQLNWTEYKALQGWICPYGGFPEISQGQEVDWMWSR